MLVLHWICGCGVRSNACKDDTSLHHLGESVFKLIFKIHIPRKPFLILTSSIFGHFYLVRIDIQPHGFKYCRFTCSLHFSRMFQGHSSDICPLDCPSKEFLWQLKCNIPPEFFSHNRDKHLNSERLDFSNSSFHPDSSGFFNASFPRVCYVLLGVKYPRPVVLISCFQKSPS